MSIKAIGLLSGGLDSALALRIILEQGIEVEAIKFTSPFCQCDQGGKCFSDEIAKNEGVKLVSISKGEEYLSVIQNPMHGYGSGMNPCIDCRIFILKKAKEYADTHGALFIFTGEVLGQRPMSQHREALDIIEKESGLAGELLRPLSAKYLPETLAEKNGWVNREKLLAITGRSRKPQLFLAKEHNISIFGCPAGGCLLTDKNFAARLREHLTVEKKLSLNDVLILKRGRHFRYKNAKIIVGRNERENNLLKNLSLKDDYLLEPVSINGPTVVVKSIVITETLQIASDIAASYADGDSSSVEFVCHHKETHNSMFGNRKDRSEFLMYAVG